MDKRVETEGDTVEQATEAALERLGASRDDVVVEILEEEGKGFLGFKRSGKARVRVSLAVSPERQLKETAERILDMMDLPGNVEVAREDEATVHVEIEGEGEGEKDDLGVLIGRRGQTLEAFQTILGVVVGRRGGERVRVTLDVEGYRRRRQEELQGLAERVAEKAISTGQAVVLRPMTPFERKAVHVALHENPDVETASDGEEPFRRITVNPKA